jgi:hypothetical protein
LAGKTASEIAPDEEPQPGPLARVPSADRWLATTLGVAWLALGSGAAGGASPGPVTAALLAAGLLCLVDLAPRIGSAAGLAASALSLASVREPAPWIALAAIAAARLWLHGGSTGDALRRARALRRERALALVATELERATHAATPEADARERALARAGDAFEEAGFARRRLAALGVGDAALVRAAPLLGRLLARSLSAAPALRERLAARAITLAGRLRPP